MFASDVLKVLYAPHKVFKKIIQDPKYWGPLLIILIFVGLQTGMFFAQYSKTYYEETSPILSQLSTWTDAPSLWTATSGTALNSNYNDIMNTTFYGNSSLELTLTDSDSLYMRLSDFDSVNCGSTGFHELYLQIKIVEPATAPSSVTLQLFSADSSSYFQCDLTSEFASGTADTWNNCTIPVGSGNWQSSGNPSWDSITGMQLNMTFPETSNITLRVGGLFFRGLYETPIEFFSVAGFSASAMFSAIFSFIIQWIALAVVFFLIIKFFKGTVTWKPVFISIAFALVTMVIESLVILVATATLPAQIHYPFEFAYQFQMSYASQIVATFSAASQATYTSVIASQIATLTTVSTIMAIGTYVWLTLIGTAIIRAITEFTWQKSLLASALSVVVTYILLSLLTAFGII